MRDIYVQMRLVCRHSCILPTMCAGSSQGGYSSLIPTTRIYTCTRAWPVAYIRLFSPPCTGSSKGGYSSLVPTTRYGRSISKKNFTTPLMPC